MNVLRTSSTRTPSLRKQSGVPAAGGLGSTVDGTGTGGRVTRAVTTSAVAGTAVLARARHQLAEPGAGAGEPSIETPSRASAWPWCAPGVTAVKPASRRIVTSASRRRRLRSSLWAIVPASLTPSYEA